MVPGKPEDHKSYRGELIGKLRVMFAIKIIKSIAGSTTLVVNRCDNIRALRRATIQPEGVKLRWKQIDLISHLSDVYQSMDSIMSLVHIHGHQNIGRPASTLMVLGSLNVLLDELSEQIMAVFLISSSKSNTMAVGLLDPHIIPIVSIHGASIHSNIAQSITYDISKRRLLQHWDDPNLTHTIDWDKMDLPSFKQAQETSTSHMAHFIMKCMSNTLPNMTILHR